MIETFEKSLLVLISRRLKLSFLTKQLTCAVLWLVCYIYTLYTLYSGYGTHKYLDVSPGCTCNEVNRLLNLKLFFLHRSLFLRLMFISWFNFMVRRLYTLSFSFKFRIYLISRRTWIPKVACTTRSGTFCKVFFRYYLSSSLPHIIMSPKMYNFKTIKILIIKLI